MKMWLLSMLLPGLLLATNACSPSDEQVKNAEPTPVPDQKPNPDSDPQPENAGGFDLPKGTNGNAPTVKLSSGYDMPILGLGTYSLHGATCVNSVKAALTVGFRKIDTASIYGNEEEVGQGVRESGVPREEIFVATKLYPNQYDNPEAAIEECLRKLDIGYVDLMLLHHLSTNDVKAYRAMEKYVAAGKIRSIGVSCYYILNRNEKHDWY